MEPRDLRTTDPVQLAPEKTKKDEKLLIWCLTNCQADGIISKLSARAVQNLKLAKKFEKKRKKFLTNWIACDRIKKFERERRTLHCTL